MKKTAVVVTTWLIGVGCTVDENQLSAPQPAARQTAVTTAPVAAPMASISRLRPTASAIAQMSKRHVPSKAFEARLNPRMLPKWKTSWERDLEAGEGMSWFGPDPRALKPELYYVTQPPTADVRVIAEHEQSQAVLFGWPPMNEAAIDKTFIDTVMATNGVAPIILAYTSTTHKTWYQQALTQAGMSSTDLAQVTFWQTDIDSVWTRDYGPVAVQSTGASPKVAFVDFRYYPGRAYDDQVPTSLAEEWGINVYRPNMEFEGGNFANTTDGLCMATLGALWFNLQIGQSAVEDIFEQYLGCKANIFLTPLEGEGTSHIDMLTRLASDTKMLVGEYTQAQDPSNKLILDANATLINATKTPTGKQMQAVRIPMPDPASAWGERIWRTYTNSLIVHGASSKAVLIPVYSDETSKEALAMQAYATAFGPDWDLVKIDSAAIIPYGGAMHCTTMQIGMGARAKIESDPQSLCGTTKRECSIVAPCGNVNSVGCCDGSKAVYCDNGTLIDYECGVYGCGWVTDRQGSYYECGGSGADPSGTFPQQCGGLPDGGVPVPDGGTPTTCGDVRYEGCCDGDVVRWCDSGVVKEKSCASGTCGWDSLLGAYNCNTNGAAEPSNTFPQVCTTHVERDAGVSLDSQTPRSDGSPAFYDGAVVITEAGVQPATDGGSSAGDTGTTKKDDGGCSVAPAPGAPSFAWLALLGLAFLRRRR